MSKLSPTPTSGAPGSRARTSRSRTRGDETGSLVSDQGSSSSSRSTSTEFDPRSFFSKTCQVYSVPMMAEILPESSWRWRNSGILSAGECLTAAISESHSSGSESMLSDIVEVQSVSPRYFLSRNAAQGILKRIQKRGRRLFPPLCEALEKLATEPSSQ